jgi:hypothetical protein
MDLTDPVSDLKEPKEKEKGTGGKAAFKRSSLTPHSRALGGWRSANSQIESCIHHVLFDFF